MIMMFWLIFWLHKLYHVIFSGTKKEWQKNNFCHSAFTCSFQLFLLVDLKD
jgi:hypothetical protein